MNKKEIEEMANVMPEKIKDPLDNSRYIILGKSLRREIARIYYNAGYRREATLTYDFIKMVQKHAVQEFVDDLRNKCSEVKGYEYSFANIAHLINQLLEE